MGNKKVLIYGASGGLGQAISTEFRNRGYNIVYSGRDPIKLNRIRDSVDPKADVIDFSILDEINSKIFKNIDIVINATGIDVRKSLKSQSLDDIKEQLELNLFGVINLTRSAIEHFTKQGYGQILHLGGFADGSWSMPYYTVDIATRAGIYAFIESINLEINNKHIVVQYFCPQPADTEAERPYHTLWKSLGIKIVSKEKVAKDILKAIKRVKKVTIEGSFLNRYISTKLRYQFPKLFTKLLFKPMGQRTMRYIDNLKEIN